MKNLILVAVALFLSANLVLAQNARSQTQPVKGTQPKAVPLKAVAAKPVSSETKQEANQSKAVSKPETKANNDASANQTKANPRQSIPVVLKKDGTPDKRYKQNQNLKKDGTPDMRYKQNKPAESKK